MEGTYLITGATGAQGGAVAKELLRQGQKVHALVRDPHSAASKFLQSLGAKIFIGDFSDVAAMTAAARGCKAVFANVSPVFTDPDGERKHLANVIEATRAAGISQIVQSSVVSLGQYQKNEIVFSELTKPFAFYYESKNACEKLIQESGIESWSIVRPGRLLNTYVGKMAAVQFPELATEGKIFTALRSDKVQTMLSPQDIGLVVAKIFLNGKLWNKVVDLGGHDLTMTDLVIAMNEALGEKRIELKHLDPNEALSLASKNPFLISEFMLNDNKSTVEVDMQSVFGFKPQYPKDYFISELAQLKAMLPSAS